MCEKKELRRFSFDGVPELEPVSRDEEECLCVCHYQKGYTHGPDCCKTCPHCGKERIKVNMFDRHVKKCPKSSENPEKDSKKDFPS